MQDLVTNDRNTAEGTAHPVSDRPGYAAGKPHNERSRLNALRRLNILDTAPEQAFDCITSLARDLLGAPIALISLIDDDRQWFKSNHGLDSAETSRDVSFCAHAILKDGILLVPDTHQDERFARNPLVTGQPGIRFYAGVPLVTREGFKLGTLCVIDTQPRAGVSETQLRSLENLATLTMAQLEARRSKSMLHRGTGLYNYDRMIDDLQVIADDPEQSGDAVYAVVLDTLRPEYFAAKVHALGYGGVATFIQGFIERIEHPLPHCRVYHVGLYGLGFIVTDLDKPRGNEWLWALVDAAREPVDCHGVPIQAQPRMGIARLERGAEAGRITLDQAQAAALDAAKAHRHWSQFDAERYTKTRRSFLLLADLPRTFDQSAQLFLEYQPQIDLNSGHCVGVEALLRWQHPQYGLVPPTEFIGIAEQTALMPRLTNWVISEAARQMVAWNRIGLDMKVSVNVSSTDLVDTNFCDRVNNILTAQGADPSRFGIELTESVVSSDLDNIISQLLTLRDMGVEISIDDFGTGASNLVYLKRIPASMVKLDQSFVRSLLTERRDQAITHTMIDLAHQLGYRVVAEGVENDAIRDMVGQWGCDQAQGYLFGRPMAPEALVAWLHTQNRSRRRVAMGAA